jgi:hypothetical protein
MFDLNLENLRRKLESENADIAAFQWEVRRAPENPTEGSIEEAEILIAEYDNVGLLHRLAEIKVLPPYLFCAKTARTGLSSHYVRIDPGYEYIWEHRVRKSLCMVPEGHPQYVAPIMEDCAILGRRHIFLNQEEVIIVYPNGTVVGPFDSLIKARNSQ